MPSPLLGWNWCIIYTDYRQGEFNDLFIYFSVYLFMTWSYRNILHAFQTILKDEGGLISGCLYKGLPPTVMVLYNKHLDVK